MSHSELKPYIWKPKDSDLTVSLVNDCRNHFGIFEQNNLYHNQFVLDNESNDLISDIQCDETFDIVKYDCNNTDMENFADTRTEFTELSSTTKQQNTNFVLNDYEKSFSPSERHPTECQEFMPPQEEISVEPSILRYAQNISPPCNYETNDLKINVTYPKLFHELLKRFSKKVTKVAIKTEIKSFLKHYVKSAINEITFLSLSSSPARSIGLDLIPNSSRNISNDEITFQSVGQKNEEPYESLNQTDSEEILIVQSLFDESMKRRDSMTSSEPPYLKINSFRNNISNNFANRVSRMDKEVMSNTGNYYLGNFDDSTSSRDLSPKHRAMATSPIQLSEVLDDTNSKLFNLLNCMSSQNSGNSEFPKFREKHKKLKSNSLSLFHRLFSRNKSKSKESSYPTGHGFLANFSRVNSNLSREKSPNHSFSSFPVKTDQSELDRLKNDWLEIDYFSKPQNNPKPQSTLLNRAASCQDNPKNSNSSLSRFEITCEESSKESHLSHLSNVPYSEVSSANNAVFIID